MLSWEHPYKHVTCVKCPDDSEHTFLPDWFLKKKQGPVPADPVPPLDRDDEASSKQAHKQ